MTELTAKNLVAPFHEADFREADFREADRD
jgi:hypothetical protein